MSTEILRMLVAEVESYYPTDLWPEPNDDEIRALNVWAPTIGRPDGSAFHVNGIRHALRLLRTLADGLDADARLSTQCENCGFYACSC